MTAQTPSIHEVCERLEMAERQNRRLTRTELIILLALVSWLTMGLVQSSKTVEANESILKDANGLVRARLQVTKSGPDLAMLDGKGSPIVSLGATSWGGALLTLQDGFQDSVSVGAAMGVPHLKISGTRNGTLFLSVTNGKPTLLFNGQPEPTSDGKISNQSGVLITADEEGPNLRLLDKEGFATEIGRAELTTLRSGKKEKTSAASVVLFGKDGRYFGRHPNGGGPSDNFFGGRACPGFCVCVEWRRACCWCIHRVS